MRLRGLRTKKKKGKSSKRKGDKKTKQEEKKNVSVSKDETQKGERACSRTEDGKVVGLLRERNHKRTRREVCL